MPILLVARIARKVYQRSTPALGSAYWASRRTLCAHSGRPRLCIFQGGRGGDAGYMVITQCDDIAIALPWVVGGGDAGALRVGRGFAS